MISNFDFSAPLRLCVRLLPAALLTALALPSVAVEPPKTLKLAVCQIGLEAPLAENRD
jgi:hypothetical protein